jgi:cytochrome c peroxidase
VSRRVLAKLVRRRLRPRVGAWLARALLGCAQLAAAGALAQTVNPHPYSPHLPPAQPLSAMARLGDRLFHDARLSGSGHMSCASCHDPARAHGPSGTASIVRGGADGRTPGFRAVPSLRYLYRQPPFTIGPDIENGTESLVSLPQQAQQASDRARSVKTALAPQASATDLVPQGGLFWDGRVNTLQQEVNGPLFNPAEMAAGTPATVLAKLRRYYARDFEVLFGPHLFDNPHLALDELMFAIGRYQIESTDFHPFTSKYDAWLEGRARFTAAEWRGYQAFNDPKRGNCAACHLDQPTRDGRPPLFTDFQYEALGVPRNPAIPANRDPRYYDLGLCGPYRDDLRAQSRYCGMFLTPTLRNVATRRVFFHNGVFHSLRQVLDWYVNRDLEPARFYPRDSSGQVVKYDDLPADDRGNVDTADAPFDRHPGERAALSAADIADVLAFLRALTDGYQARQPRVLRLGSATGRP